MDILQTAPAVAGKILMLFIVLLVGVYGRKRKIIDEDGTKTLSKLLLGVTQPLMLVSSFEMEFSSDKLVIGLKMLVLSVVMHTVLSVIARLLFMKFEPRKRTIFEMGFIFGNCAFLGYPVLEVVFPGEGIFYGAFYTIYFNIYIWTYGLSIINRYKEGEKVQKRSIAKILINPGTVTSAVGIIIFVGRITLPEVLSSAVEMVGDMTFPVSMLIIGSIIADMDLKKIFTNIRVYFFCLMRLIVLPLAATLLCFALGLDKTISVMCIIMCSVPVASLVGTFAELHDCDSPLAAETTAMSTLFSMITIPLNMYIAGFLFA